MTQLDIITTGGYYHEINIARGITILFVILGHSFPDLGTGITNPIAQWIFMTIYSFHMGAFFFFSGFVSAKKLLGTFSLAKEIKRKLWRLGMPYLVFSFISLLIKVFLPAFASEEYEVCEFWKVLIGISPNGTMWFLWTLLVVSILFLLISKLLRGREGRVWVFLAVGILMHILYYVLPKNLLSAVLRFSLFYALGILANRYYEKLSNLLIQKKGYTVLALALFVAGNIIDGIPYAITCILANYVILSVSYQVAKSSGVVKTFLNEMGSYSFDLYLISYFVQRPLRWLIYSKLQLNYGVVVLLMFLGGIAVTYVVCRYAIRRSEKLEYLLLGKTWF